MFCVCTKACILIFFLTVHHSIELFHQPTLMHNFLCSLTICLLHCYPRHVSSINMPIFRRKNCIHAASGIFALCKGLHSTLVESGLQSALKQLSSLLSEIQSCIELGGPCAVSYRLAIHLMSSRFI